MNYKAIQENMDFICSHNIFKKILAQFVPIPKLPNNVNTLHSVLKHCQAFSTSLIT